jgi:hypothetical protein
VLATGLLSAIEDRGYDAAQGSLAGIANNRAGHSRRVRCPRHQAEMLHRVDAELDALPPLDNGGRKVERRKLQSQGAVAPRRRVAVNVVVGEDIVADDRKFVVTLENIKIILDVSGRQVLQDILADQEISRWQARPVHDVVKTESIRRPGVDIVIGDAFDDSRLRRGRH